MTRNGVELDPLYSIALTMFGCRAGCGPKLLLEPLDQDGVAGGLGGDDLDGDDLAGDLRAAL